jgi:Ca-activated chloride channel family protein
MFSLTIPWILLLLPLPFLLWHLLPRAKIQLPLALKIPFFDAMTRVIDEEKQLTKVNTHMVMPFIIWILLVCALSGPRWVGEPIPISRDGYNIMMALDLSESMEINDMLFQGRPMSRLAVVKRAAKQFVKDRPTDKIGLILFGTQAYLQTPLTYDKQSVLLRIEDASVGLAGKTTSIGDALGLAVKRLQDVPAKGRMIILLTDGANNSGILQPLKAAELAKADGIKVYTIGLGSEGSSQALGGFFIANASADLDEDTLKGVSKLTGGQYFRATDTESLHKIYKTINSLEKVEQEQATIRPQKDYYAWLLTAAGLLFFYWLLNTMDLREAHQRLFQSRNKERQDNA